MIQRCPSCEKKNRVPAARLLDGGSCGVCKKPLPPPSRPLEANPQTFDEVTRASPVPVLIDFWAPWCGPCRAAAPILDRVAQRMAGKAVVLKVNTDTYPQLAQRFGVRGIPNLVVMRGGAVVKQQAGVVPEAQLVAWLQG